MACPKMAGVVPSTGNTRTLRTKERRHQKESLNINIVWTQNNEKGAKTTALAGSLKAR